MAFELDFERPLAEIEKRIQSLQKRGDRLKPDERAQITALEEELDRRTHEIYADLTPWQRVQIARHKQRPYTMDYIKLACDDFFELRGDRRFGDDRAMIGGLAGMDGQTIMLVGHQKGRDTKERQEANFGMAHAEGYRKAQRCMLQAEKFHLPVVCLIDTPGAALDLDAELRGISQAIADNLMVMARLRTPILAIVIGEGGSGGALGISVADRILLMENAYYTVAAPEAAASIMWRDNAFAPSAAEAMKITAPDLLALELIEGVIAEPLGGAHRDHRAAAAALKHAILTTLAELRQLPMDELLEARYQRYRKIGVYAGEAVGVTPSN
jgi:acetyl-CoA carboxylase carboxyl transferase subunit alpha